MSENSNIIDVTETEFNDQVIEASESKLIVVDFWAPWCGPCKQLTPILEKIISKSGDKITLVKINIDENQQIAAQLRIQSIPTVYAFKDKQIVNAFQGLSDATQATINAVAPGISEALIATALGLFAAIPAVLAFNKFTVSTEAQIKSLSVFGEELVSIFSYSK